MWRIWRIGLKHTWPLYLKFHFNWAIINPLETASLGKMFNIFAVLLECCKMLPLIIKNSPFLCIIAIFLNNNLWKIRCLSNLLKWFDFYWRLLDKEVHFYKDCYDMFHIHKIFYQMITVENGFTWHTQLKKLKRNFKQFFIFFLPKNWISLKKIYISFSQIFFIFSRNRNSIALYKKTKINQSLFVNPINLSIFYNIFSILD